MCVNLTVNEIITIIAIIKKGKLYTSEVTCNIAKEKLIAKKYAVKTQSKNESIMITDLGRSIYNLILKP